MWENERQIAHFDLDTFFVSVERLNNSALMGLPVIVGGGDRGVVAACSYEARKYGVHSAMPMSRAKFLCPDAVIISGDYDSYAKLSGMVTEVIADCVPLYEKASIDEFYIDMTGMDRFHKTAVYVSELGKRISKETGLPVSFAIARNKLVSKVATNEVKPNGRKLVKFGHEKQYLAPLSIHKMPMIGAKTAGELLDLGIKTIRTLSEIKPVILQQKFGANGLEMSRRANGIDESPVVPYREQKGISRDTTFHSDTIDLTFLNSKLVTLLEDAAFELRQQGKMCGCLSVKIRYSDFNTYSKQTSFYHTASENFLLTTAKELFAKLYERRLLVRLIGIKLTDLVSGHHQIDLFGDTQENIKLFQAMDFLKNKYGAKAVMRAQGIAEIVRKR